MYKLLPVLCFCSFFTLVWDENTHFVTWSYSYSLSQTQLKPTSYRGLSVTGLFHIDFYLLLFEGIGDRPYSFWLLAIYGFVQTDNKQFFIYTLPLLQLINKFPESECFVPFIFHQYVIICITSTQQKPRVNG